MKKILLVSALMLGASLANAETQKKIDPRVDPRMRRPAVLEAHVCTLENGCRWMTLVGPDIKKEYGTVDNPQVVTDTLTLASCNELLAEGAQTAEVTLAIRLKREKEIRILGMRCSVDTEKEV